jgi:hypothetical protein
MMIRYIPIQVGKLDLEERRKLSLIRTITIDCEIFFQVQSKKFSMDSRTSLVEAKNLLFLTCSFMTFHNRSMGFRLGL